MHEKNMMLKMFRSAAQQRRQQQRQKHWLIVLYRSGPCSEPLNSRRIVNMGSSEARLHISR
jgi:hypothetical protein